MLRIATIGAGFAALAALLAGPLPDALIAQGTANYASPEAARDALDTARRQQRNARARGERLEAEAARAREDADRATRQAAALAARVQQAEAAIAATEAEFALIRTERRRLDLRLAERREPLVQLTAALQSMARRPLTLSAFQRGSLTDVVHTRAILASTLPVVERRTAALRGELGRARALEARTGEVLADRRDAETTLATRRRELVALAERERIRARRSSGGASREAERALALAEEARDLDGLVGELDRAASLGEKLAALPGPIMRPADPGARRNTPPPSPQPTPSETAPPDRYRLPVAGRIAAGFGAEDAIGLRQSGLVLVPRPRAQVVAPAAGRVAFAGPYRGYGNLVILDHGKGWISVVTGLATLDTRTGDELTGGSPLGLAAARDARVGLELRRAGTPVNPLDWLR